MTLQRVVLGIVGASWFFVVHSEAANVNCPCDSAISNGVAFTNLRVDSSVFDQIETTIDVVDKGTTTNIMVGHITQWGLNCNPRYISRQVGFAYSTNSGAAWAGTDTIPPGSVRKLGDPWVVISPSDTAYFCYLDGLTNRILKLDWTGDGGTTWHGPVVLDSITEPDKPAMATGFVPSHPDTTLIHIAYFGGGANSIRPVDGRR